MASHAWSVWSGWFCLGNGQDMRERHCLDATCGETQTEYRKCRH